MRKIVGITFGSHLYGTATPASDLDIKSVYVPDARDILLQRVKGSISGQRRPKAEGEKNLAGELDEESYSLQRYLGLVAEGQTVALDMLFAPPRSMYVRALAEWHEIVKNRHRLVTRRYAAFIDYCKKQANKFGIKGSRVAASRAALNLLKEAVEKHGTVAKLGLVSDEICALVNDSDHMALPHIEQVSGQRITHWDVCGRKMSFTASIKMAQGVMQRLVDEYGHRALAAEKQQGVDWKALSHAVRVGHQAVELLDTGRVTFPLPNAAHILSIKKGELPYQRVAEEIETLLVEVEAAAARSMLPDEPDFAWIDDFVCAVYGEEVVMDAACRR